MRTLHEGASHMTRIEIEFRNKNFQCKRGLRIIFLAGNGAQPHSRPHNYFLENKINANPGIIIG